MRESIFGTQHEGGKKKKRQSKIGENTRKGYTVKNPALKPKVNRRDRME